MRLIDFIRQQPDSSVDKPGAKIPWDDPEFSRRMLACHLDQGHDWASRRETLIDRHVAWIAQQLPPAPSRILDLACGPGLYTQRLAALGHDCVGVDFAPAAVEYANAEAAKAGLSVEYVLADIRQYQPLRRFDAVLLTFGEFNVFTEADAVGLLSGCRNLLAPGGFFLLETHTLEAVRNVGQTAASWQRMERGLFSDAPHLYLEEHAWDEAGGTATTRYGIVDAATGEVRIFASTMRGYGTERQEQMLLEAGLHPCPGPDTGAWPAGESFAGDLQVWCARTSSPAG